MQNLAGINVATSRVLTFTAGETETLRVTGTFFRVLSGARVLVRMGSREIPQSGEFPMAAGASVTCPFVFEEITITSPTAQTIEVFAFYGDYRDDSLVASAAFAVNTKPLGFDMSTPTQVSVTAASNVLLAAANPLRRYLGVFNEGADNLYIRTDATTAKSPLVLGPDSFLPVPFVSVVRAYNPSATACNCLIAEFV